MKTMLPLAIAGAIMSIGPAWAVPTTIWAVEATATGPGVSYNAYAEQFSLTGQLLQRVNLGAGFNPNGIAIVGNTGYVSSDTNLLYTFNLGTGALGATYATGQNALGPLAFDGTDLLAGDATGGTLVYRLSLTGASLGSFSLGNCGSYCNGLDYAAGTLVANRGPNTGPFDRYSTAGALLQPNTFDAGDGGAVAYNPDTGLLYAAVSGGQGGFQTSSGGPVVAFEGTIADSGFGTSDRFINDLAIQVPEPATLGLLAAGLGLLGLRRRRA